MSQYVAAYDIRDDRRRERVARVLLGYGERIQRSVYRIWIEPDDLPELKRRLGPILGQADAFALFPIDERGSRSVISWQNSLPQFEPVWLV